MLPLRGLAQGREHRAVQARLAVDVPRRHPVPDHGAAAARIDGNLLPAQPLQHVAGVAARVFQGLVPSHDGEAQEFQVRAVCRQQDGDGVVVPGIAVADDLLSCHRCLSLLKGARLRLDASMVTYSFFNCNGNVAP